MTATVLSVDADRQLLQIVEKALVGEGYRSLVAHDGVQALAIVRDECPDLVVLDLMIPRRNGFDVFGEIGAACRGPRGLVNPSGKLHKRQR